MLAIVSFIIILVVLIFVHEMGHFLSARAMGVEVLEFGFGYPPRLVAVRRGETEYSLNLLPLGGFVRLVGEDDPREPGGLAGRGIGPRLLVFSAGSLMNLLLPVVLFSVAFMLPNEMVAGRVLVEQVVADSPAERAGMEPGDTILMINDRPIRNNGDVYYNTELNLGSEMTMLLQKPDGSQRVARVTPRWESAQMPLGIWMKLTEAQRETEAYPPWEAVPLGIRRSFDMLTLMKNGLVSLVRSGEMPMLTGPVGIAQMTTEVAQGGLVPLMVWAAFLSLNLGILNLLPFPALDGGRIVFVLLEFIRRGKRISPEKEKFVHLIGFALLIALIIVVSYFDVLRLIRGGSLFQ